MKYCKICRHEHVSEINMNLIEGTPLRAIAKEFEVGVNSLFNHKKNHLGNIIKKSFDRVQRKVNNEVSKKIETMEIAKVSADFDLLTKILWGENQAEQIYKTNFEEKNWLIALKSLQEIRSYAALAISTLAQVNASKQLELDLAKARNDGSSPEEIAQAAKELEVFNIEELEVMQRLGTKKLEQSNNTIIINGKVLPLKY